MIAQITNTVVTNPTVQQAITTLARVFIPHVSEQQMEDIIVAIFVLARAARKAIPDKYQQAILGTILKHLALEINPQDKPLPSDIKLVDVIKPSTVTTQSTIVSSQSSIPSNNK